MKGDPGNMGRLGKQVSSIHCTHTYSDDLCIMILPAQGIPGTPGTDGYPGVPGRQGQPGIKGSKGDDGDDGMKGDQGRPGKSGFPVRLQFSFSTFLPLFTLDMFELGHVCYHVQGIPGRKGPPGERGQDGRMGPPGNDVSC